MTAATPGLASRLGRALLRTVAVYGLIVWAYLAVNSLTHPETMSMPLTHLLSWPTEGLTATLAFAASALAFLLLRVRTHRSAS